MGSWNTWTAPNGNLTLGESIRVSEASLSSAPPMPLPAAAPVKRSRVRKSTLILAALALFNVAYLLHDMLTVPKFPGDFAAFYTAARLYRQQPGPELYNLDRQMELEPAITDTSKLPYAHLPYELLLWLPLGGMSYKAAYFAWRGMCLVLLAAAAWLLARGAGRGLSAPWILVVALAFFPVAYCIWFGQDSLLVLTLLAATAWRLREGKPFSAGVCLALALFKFQFVLPIVAVYFLRRHWRLVAGFACGAAAVLAACVAMVGVSGLRRLVEMQLMMERVPGLGVNPKMMPNLRGLATLLLGGHPRLATALVLAASAGLLAWAAWKFDERMPSERSLALLVCFACLVSYHMNLHDLSLLLMPLLLVVAGTLWRVEGQRWTVYTTIALFCAPVYFSALNNAKVATLGVLVAGLWYGLEKKQLAVSN